MNILQRSAGWELPGFVAYGFKAFKAWGFRVLPKT